jgi:hypothetical protein
MVFDLKEKGFDPEREISMLEVARGMIQYSSKRKYRILNGEIGVRFD